MRSDLFDLAARLVETGTPFAVATVVRREPPSSAQLGDTALITLAGDFHGWLGGSCTRPAVVREAQEAIRSGRPRLISLTPDPDSASRTGITVLPMTCHSGGSVEIYVEPHRPPDRLMVFGATELGRALVRLAAVVGYAVEVVDPEADPADFPGVTRVHREPAAIPSRAAAGSERLFAVVATYGVWDEEAIRAALALDPVFLALVAGRERFEVVREVLISSGVEPEALDRVASPAGLDIGARTPAEIAVSILAQIVQVARATPGADHERDEAPAAPPREGQEEGPRDPVCGMVVSRELAPSVEHGGRTYHFCCPGCRERFLAAPEEYAVPA